MQASYQAQAMGSTGMPNQPQENLQLQKKQEHPSPQLIFIRQQASVISVSIPNLQQYFVNLTQANSDYAFLQVIYYDFPIGDSPQTVLGVDTLTFTVTISYTYYTENTAAPSIIGVIPCSFDITISLANITSLDTLCEQINAQFLRWLSFGQAASDTLSVLTSKAMSFIKDFSYDSSSQKFVFTIGPSTDDDQNFQSYNVLSGGVTTSYTTDILSVFVTFAGKSPTAFTSKQNKFLANMFGGTYDALNNNWSTTFKYDQLDPLTYYQSIGGLYQMVTPFKALAGRTRTTNLLYKTQLSKITSFSAYSENCGALVYDPYLYLRGAPEGQFWGTDGGSSNILAILPRNRGVNSSVSTQSAYLTQATFPMKTSLQSLRVMNLYITDKDGDMCQFNTDFILQLGVLFNID